MTFVQWGNRAFSDRNILRPLRRRSESRLKTYPSSIDLRTWCDTVEERRQHIVEHITKDIEKCYGKLIPLDAIINALAGAKVANCEAITKCFKQLLEFIDGLKLDDADTQKLKQLKAQMDSRCGVGGGGDEEDGNFKRRARHANYNDDDSDDSDKIKNSCVAKERHLRERAEIEALLKGKYIIFDDNKVCELQFLREEVERSIKFYSASGDVYKVPLRHPRLKPREKGKVVTTFQGPGKQITRIKGISPGFVVGTPTEQPGNITVKATAIKTKITNARPIARDVPADPDSAEKPEKAAGSHEKTKSHSVEKMVVSSNKKTLSYHDSNNKKALLHHEGAGTKKKARTLGDQDDGSDTEMAKSQSDSGYERVRDKLAATEALCQEQQAKLAELQKERDDLKQKLGDCMRELENFKKLNTVANPELPASCQQEIEALEAEIQIMRSGNPSPEKEGEIIKKEIDMIKKYCSKLKQIEDENIKLKSQLSVSKGVGDQGMAMGDIKEKLDNLEKLTKERDALANRVHMLEQKLRKYEDVPNDVEELRNRSQILDNVLKERDDINQKCKAIKDIEREMEKLRAKADRADELERELRVYSKYDKSGTELKRTQSICGCLENELRNVKAEKEAMNRRIENMRRELDSSRNKIRENEILRLERDRLQIQLNQLSGLQEERDLYKAKYDEILEMECRCQMLKRKLEEANSVSRERDHLKKQVEDLETCICEQESEIKNLVTQVESMSRNSNGDTEHLLNTMKNEIKLSNDKLISEKARISQLEMTLHKAEYTIRQKECHIKCLEQQIRSSKKLNKAELEQVECMCQELAAAKAENKKLQNIAQKMASLSGDPQLKKMLQQSECTAIRLVEELGKQYKGWSNTKQKSYGDSNNNKTICLCNTTDESDGCACEKLRNDLEILEKEKQVLQNNLKQIQSSERGSCRC